MMGRGCFIAERTIEVALSGRETRTLRGDQVFLDIGAFARRPALAGLTESTPLTHVELLDPDTIPDHLLVLGAGGRSDPWIYGVRPPSRRRVTAPGPDCDADAASLPRNRGVGGRTLHLRRGTGLAFLKHTATCADMPPVP